MEPGRTEMDEPLGQVRSRRRSRRVSLKSVLVVVCALVGVGVSGAIALRERPFSVPSSVILKSEVAPDEAELVPSVASAEEPTGPSIIHADSGSPRSSGNAIIIRDPASADIDPRFVHLPDRSLVEESETGPLPVRAVDGRRPFDAYARPWSGARGARIALVIGGLGISQTGTQEAIEKLPSGVTLAFAPLGNSLMRWMQTARRDGHEIILQVPLEPFGYPATNPGRHTLFTQAASAQNLEDLRWVLSRITNYIGVMNYMGARFTADREAMDLLMDELRRRGLAYLDDGTSARSLAEEIAMAKGVPFAASDAVIDQVRERGAILAKLDELERIARARGFSIGGGSALEVTVETVAAWASEVTARGIELVPVSAVTFDPERRL